MNPVHFPELGARDAEAQTTTAHTRSGVDTSGERGKKRPAAELPGRTFWARGLAPPPESLGQSEATQAPPTDAAPSPTGAPAAEDSRPAGQRNQQQPTSSPADPARPGEAQQTSSPAETARGEHLASSLPAMSGEEVHASATAPGEKGFPRALRGNKPVGFPQEPSSRRGGNLPGSSRALSPHQNHQPADLPGGEADLRALLEQLTRVVAALAMHLPQQSLSGLHKACTEIITAATPNATYSTNHGGKP